MLSWQLLQFEYIIDLCMNHIIVYFYNAGDIVTYSTFFDNVIFMYSTSKNFYSKAVKMPFSKTPLPKKSVTILNLSGDSSIELINKSNLSLTSV